MTFISLLLFCSWFGGSFFALITIIRSLILTVFFPDRWSISLPPVFLLTLNVAEGSSKRNCRLFYAPQYSFEVSFRIFSALLYFVCARFLLFFDDSFSQMTAGCPEHSSLCCLPSPFSLWDLSQRSISAAIDQTGKWKCFASEHAGYSRKKGTTLAMNQVPHTLSRVKKSHGFLSVHYRRSASSHGRLRPKRFSFYVFPPMALNF